jgi:hypothetical protein
MNIDAKILNKVFANQAGHRWPTPVTLATQEAEIRRITVQSQPWQIVCKTLSLNGSLKHPSQKKGW